MKIKNIRISSFIFAFVFTCVMFFSKPTHADFWGWGWDGNCSKSAVIGGCFACIYTEYYYIFWIQVDSRQVTKILGDCVPQEAD